MTMSENAESLAELFAMDDHKVIVAYDGQQAIEAFSLNKVDIGFFDVMMPGKNGVESFIEIKQSHPDAQGLFHDRLQRRGSAEEGHGKWCQGRIRQAGRPAKVLKMHREGGGLSQSVPRAAMATAAPAMAVPETRLRMRMALGLRKKPRAAWAAKRIDARGS